MAASPPAPPSTLRAGAMVVIFALGWWLALAGLSVAHLLDQPRPTDAVRWQMLLLSTTYLLLAVAAAGAVGRLLAGSRTGWGACSALLLVLVLHGLSHRTLAVPLVAVLLGSTGLGLLLTPSARRYIVDTPCAPLPSANRSRRRRALLAVAAVAVFVWYAAGSVNLLIEAGRIRVDGRPPCESSSSYNGQILALHEWLSVETRAGRLPLNSTEMTLCPPGSFTPAVATAHIKAGGAPVVRARLKELGCDWRGDLCTITLDRIRSKARIIPGRDAALQLWPAQ